MLTAIRKIYTSLEAREQLAVFTSHLLLNASFFIVMFLASLKLSSAEFADLSVANSWIVMLAIVMGFGMDQSALKLSIENKTSSYIAINIFIKASLLVLTLLILLSGLLMMRFNSNLGILAASAGIAFWTSTRAVEQYHQRFMRLACLNVAFAAARVGIGGIALATQDWVIIILALHIIAQSPVHLVTFATTMRDLRKEINWSNFRAMLVLSPLMLASASLFSSLPLITQSILHSQNSVDATSSFGVALIFIAPLSMLVGTIRIYVLPQILSRDLKDVSVFSLGGGSFHLLAIVFTVALLVGIVPAAAVIHWIYSDRWPMAATFFLIYFGAQILTQALGLYNIRAQRQNLIRIDLAVNACRVAATVLIWVIPGVGPLEVVIYSALILVAGEITLFGALSWADRVHDLP